MSKTILNSCLSVKVPWDADRVAERVKNIKPTSVENDTKLKTFFKEVCLGHFDDPVIIVDSFGAILAWHLPGILSKSRIVRLTPFPSSID
jgi:hypothetical protein